MAEVITELVLCSVLEVSQLTFKNMAMKSQEKEGFEERNVLS